MISGLGVSEILVVLTLALLFFGSRELPHMVREAARLLARMRGYADKVRRELDDVGRSLDVNQSSADDVREQKQELRRRYEKARRDLGADTRAVKSREVCERLAGEHSFQKARAVMIYVSMGAEVETDRCIRDMLARGVRVAVPYCRTSSASLCLGEITDPDADLSPGAHGVMEPREHARDNFFRSDLQLVICPGVAFDIYGGRLGRGKSYYDRFLQEIKGRIPVYGLAFDCQICPDPLPFAYHDIAMDQVVTESGLVIKRRAAVRES